MSYPPPYGWEQSYPQGWLPPQPQPPQLSTAEKTVTWVLWAFLVLLSVCGSGLIFLSGLLWGLMDDMIASAGGPAEHAGRMTVWFLVLSFVLLVEPWPVLAVILRGIKRGQHVWYWPVTALIVAIAIVVDLAVAGG